MTVTLYQFELSPFCDKVRRVLHVKGIDYRVEEVTIADTLKGRLKQLSPAAKLPVLEIDGERIADSTEIARVLEARFPEPALLPSDPREQALVHFLEDWADESLYFLEVHLRFTLPHNAERWVPEAAKHDGAFVRRLAALVMPGAMLKTSQAQGTGRKPLAVIRHDLDRHCHMLNRWLAGRDWLVGNTLTLADIAVYAQMACLAGTVEGQDVLRGYDRVRAWMDRVDRATAAPGAAA